MSDAKAVYAAIASVLTVILLKMVPIEGLAESGVATDIRFLIEIAVHSTVQATAVYWTAWWATNKPAAPETSPQQPEPTP